MEEALDGIAAADARLGVPFPLPTHPLPLVRWVEVTAAGADGAEVAWNLDDSREGAPGRLALYAGRSAPAPHDLDGATAADPVAVGAHTGELRTAPLAHAQASLRPVTEVAWRDGPLHLRLTAQGPWAREDVLAIAATVRPPAGPAGV